MLRSWLPWTLSVLLLAAAAFVGGLALGGDKGERPSASIALPEADQEMLSILQEAQAERDTSRRERDAARGDAERLRRERDAARAKSARLERALADATRRAERAEAALAETDVRFDVLEARLSASRARAQSAEAEAAAMRDVRRRVRESACRALAESIPDIATLPNPRPASDAFVEAGPTDARRMDLAKGVLAYECTEYASAYRLWLPLAQAGYPRAQFHVGALFYEGRGIRRDDALAFAWLTLAARHGSEAAKSLLDVLRARMDQAATRHARQLLDRAG